MLNSAFDEYSAAGVRQDVSFTTSTGTSVLERPVTCELDPGDHEKLAHYVRKEKIVESAITGGPVVALCGKVWTPGRDPEKFPVCPECKEIYETLRLSDD